MRDVTKEGLVGRLAPSPTGVLHLGNARSLLLAWLSARSRGGRVLLRIEDIDGPRVKAGAVEATLKDLAWLGLDYDGSVMYQSQRSDAYTAAIAQLLASGLAYPCVCSRKEVAEAASAPHESWQDAVPYPGTCRGLYANCAEAKAVTGRDPAVRLRVDASSLPFVDGCHGPQEGLIRGDFVIQKRDGGPAYQLAVVVDDASTGVTEVLRGDDLLVSTPRQLHLYQLLGWPAPDFVHVPLVLGEDGRRLAKRHGDTSLAYFRSEGFQAEKILGYLAWSSGLRPDCEPCRAADLVAGFDMNSLPRDPVVAQPPWFEVS